jgi:hypothetical protein
MRKLHRTISRLVLRTNSKQSKRGIFPPELWLTIFEDLTSSDIANVRLTCRSFAALGKFQAFSLFRFHPFRLVSSTTDYRLAFANERHALRLERLQYWTSPDIAPLVRRCKVEPEYSVRRLGDIVDQGEDADSLIDAFFEILPHFYNLRHMEFLHVPFSDKALLHLCGLKKLKSFAVTDCVVTATAAPRPLLGVADVFFYAYNTFYGSIEERGSVGWLDVLNPDTIRHISIYFPKPKIIHLRGIATMRSLCDLSASEADIVHRHIISILSHPSALEELHISHYLEKTSHEIVDPPIGFVIGSFSLPSLRLYHGPHQYLSWFVTGQSLHTVTCTPCNMYPYVSPLALQHTLEQDHIGDSIRSLTFHTTHIPDTLLTTIRSRFTHITDLNMSAKQVDEDQVSSFSEYQLTRSQIFLIQLIKSVTSSLPPSIETVSLDIWHLGSSITRAGWIKRGLPLRRNLFNNYPSLRRTTCTLFHTYVAFDWRRSDSISNWKIVRMLKSVAYVCGLRSEA